LEKELAEMKLQLKNMELLKKQFAEMQAFLRESSREKLLGKNLGVSEKEQTVVGNIKEKKAVSDRENLANIFAGAHSSTFMLPDISTSNVLKQKYSLNDSQSAPLPSEKSAKGNLKSSDTVSGVPLRPNKSLDESNFEATIDMSQLSQIEKLTLQQVSASRAASEAQNKISAAIGLEQRRKSLPKINKFSDDPKDWIRFKRDIERYRTVGCYEDETLKMYILQALDGIALERVQDIIDISEMSVTLHVLEEGFGQANKIIERCGGEIMSIKLSKELFRDDVMRINTKIQAYFSACHYGKIREKKLPIPTIMRVISSSNCRWKIKNYFAFTIAFRTLLKQVD
jgi:hypothetical protein